LGVTGAGAVTVTVTVAGAVTMAGAVAGKDLLKTFGKLHTFLILAGIASGGLGLGWLVGLELLSRGVGIPGWLDF